MRNENLQGLFDLMENEPALAFFTIATVLLVGGIVLVTAFTSVRKIVVSKSVEKSRREIAAYVAEGSIDPDDAERLLSANPHKIAKPHARS